MLRDFGELRFREGAPLTKDALAEGARRLRNTALFDAVNIVMPDLDATSSGQVNAVVEVTERYDRHGQMDAEVGYSTFNGMFVRAVPTLKNLFGRGISLEVAGTIGFELPKLIEDNELQLKQLSVESTLRFPQWLSRRISPVESAITARDFTPRSIPTAASGRATPSAVRGPSPAQGPRSREELDGSG